MRSGFNVLAIWASCFWFDLQSVIVTLLSLDPCAWKYLWIFWPLLKSIVVKSNISKFLRSIIFLRESSLIFSHFVIFSPISYSCWPKALRMSSICRLFSRIKLLSSKNLSLLFSWNRLDSVTVEKLPSMIVNLSPLNRWSTFSRMLCYG